MDSRAKRPKMAGSSQRRERFEEDGFLVVPGFASVAECDAMMAGMAAIVDRYLHTHTGRKRTHAYVHVPGADTEHFPGQVGTNRGSDRVFDRKGARTCARAVFFGLGRKRPGLLGSVCVGGGSAQGPVVVQLSSLHKGNW